MSDIIPAVPISRTVDDRILVRERDLAEELMGSLTFTQMFLFDLTGRIPSPSHLRFVDAVLVTAMEHGITPSTLVTRLVLDGSPDSGASAVAAGLLASGSRFLGVTENVAALVRRTVRSAKDVGIEAAARERVAILASEGRRVPGYGHNLHQAEDPRVERLLSIARSEGVNGPHLRAYEAIGRELNRDRGMPLIKNAAGVAGSVLSDLGYSPSVIGGFSLVSRCAGLVAHAADEEQTPIARQVWQGVHGAATEAGV